MAAKCTVYLSEVSALSDPALFAAGMERVPESRREKVRTLRHEDIRRQSLGAGLLLTLALKERGVEGRDARILESSLGKPYLPDAPEIHFSLSHAGIWAMCAVGNAPLGCDVERLGRGSERLAARFFHPEEQAYLTSFGKDTESAWQRAFTRIWTRKESLLKAAGTGLSVPMNSFSVLADPPGMRFEEPPETLQDTGRKTMEVRSAGQASEKAEYLFSLCVRRDEADPEWRAVLIEQMQ